MICPKCATEINPSPGLPAVASAQAGHATCPNCGFQLPQIPTKLLWDDNGPFFFRFFNTVNEILSRPTDFFKRMPVNAGIGKPLLYALIVGMISTLGSMLWVLVFITSQAPSMWHENLPFTQVPGYMLFFAIIISSPIQYLIMCFSGAGIIHLSLMMVGGNKKGFQATFRATCYSNTPMILTAIPLIGSSLGLLWASVVVVIGLKEAHQISVARIIIASLIPFTIGLACFIAALVFVLSRFSSLYEPYF